MASLRLRRVAMLSFARSLRGVARPNKWAGAVSLAMFVTVPLISQRFSDFRTRLLVASDIRKKNETSSVVSGRGNTRIGDYSYIGIGCTVFHNIEIGRNCIVGGGSLVIRNTSSDSVFFGSPAKFISSRILENRFLMVG